MAWVYRRPPPHPRRVPWIPSAVSADQTIAVGVANESEAAVAVAVVFDLTVLVGAVAETETAQPVSPIQSIAVGVATETEAAGIIGFKLGVGQAAEVESAVVVAVVTPLQTIVVGVATERETARPVVNPNVGLGINPFQNASLATIFLLSPLKLDTTAGRDARQVRFVGWFFKSTAAEAHTVREELITIMNDLQEVKITYDGEPGYNGTYFIRRARVDSDTIGPGLYQYQIDAQYVGAL